MSFVGMFGTHSFEYNQDTTMADIASAEGKRIAIKMDNAAREIFAVTGVIKSGYIEVPKMPTFRPITVKARIETCEYCGRRRDAQSVQSCQGCGA